MIAEPITDQRERDRALDVSRSFIVQAPAGSGKTTLLVQRYLRLLEVSRKPEEVLAITFTRKAAAEMRKRVLEKIPDPGELAHRLRIMTIDAFCASLTRQLPVLSRFGAQPAIVEDASALHAEAARRTLAAFEQPAVGRLLSHLDNHVESAIGMLAGMLGRRDQWLRRTGNPPSRKDIEAALAAERRRILAQAHALLPEASPELAEKLLTQKRTWRKRDMEAQQHEGNEPLRLALSALLDLPPQTYSEAQWEALEAILALLPLAAAQLKILFAERGEADFTEIAQGAVRALGSPEEPTDLLLALDARIAHVLVDEFQDTSLSQWDLLERLTAGWSPGDGRTVLAVGDPMQSIYRFREAEVGLFLRARREGLANVKLESLALATNFRSQAGVVDWVNASFSRILPQAEDETAGAVPYSPSVAKHPALAGEAVTWHAPADPASEAAQVVELVRQAGKDCALLVRNRGALAEIVPALKAAGLRFRAIEIDQLGEKQVVQDLFALTRALTHLADRVAWLAVLRAPWAGFTLAELAHGFEGHADTIWERLQDVTDRLHLKAVLGDALAQRQRGTLRDRVEGAWLALGGPACVAGAEDLEDAETYLDALEALEEAGEVDFARLAELLQTLYAPPDPAAAESDLQIMTIHKAKGLEFGTVIVPGLARAPGRGGAPLLRWRELAGGSQGGGLLMAPVMETGGDKEPAYEYLKQLDREAEDTEAGRLLYVAATRAKHRLHLLACSKKTLPPKRSLLERAWPVARDFYDRITPSAEESNAAADSAFFPLRRLPADWVLPAPPPPVAWTAPDGGPAAGDIEFSWVGEDARHIGTVVHAWLQRIADDELQGWDAKRVASLKRAFSRDLARRGVQDPGAAAELVASALANAIADERGRWLLGSHAKAVNEYRITTPARNFRIDRYLEDTEGAKWVVDYKSSGHRGGGLEAFLDAQRERYAAQLDAYAEAVGGAKRGLYFPLLKGWRAW